MQINFLDIVVVFSIAISGVIAFMDGIVSELLGIAGWIIAIFAVQFLFPFAFAEIAGSVPQNYHVLASVILYIIMFIVFVMVFSYWTRKIQRHIHTTDFKIADKYLGLLFGALRGFFFAVLFYIFLLWFISDPADRPEWIFKARFRPSLIVSAEKVVSFLPATPTFDEIKFLVRLDKSDNRDGTAKGNTQKAIDKNQIPASEIEFQNIRGTSERAKQRISAMEIRALQNSLKTLREANEIRKEFIKE